MNKEKPLISIIIPAFNSESFIDRTIQSVINQTIADYEIIVVNDHSTDKTKDILSKWVKIDNRIKIIDTKGFGGPVEPMNTGINNSSGEYIAFLDHDDTWESSKLEVIIENFIKSDADMIISAVFLSEKNTKKISRLENNNIETILSGKYFNTFTSIVIKKDLIESVGLIDNNVKILPDYEFIVRTISRNKKVIFLKEPLATHFFHENNLSSPKKSLEKRSSDLLYILSKHAPYLSKYRKIKSYILSTVGTISLKTHRRKKAISYFLKSFFVYPLNIKSLFKGILCIFGETTYDKMKALADIGNL